MEIKKEVIKFISSTDSSLKDKIRIVLYIAGVKPNTFIMLKLKNDFVLAKQNFETFLKRLNSIYLVNSPKTYEEVSEVTGNKIRWNVAGTWFGYDLLKDKKALAEFMNYRKLFLQDNKYKEETAEIAGKLYGYPECCIANFIKETDSYLRKNFTFYSLSKRNYDIEQKFPFISHTPCSLKCKETIKLNNLYSKTIKKNTPELWKEFTKKQRIKSEAIVESENDILDSKGNPLFAVKDAYEYQLIIKKPINGKYYFYPILINKRYDIGQVLDITLTKQYNTAYIKIKKENDVITDIHHERKLELLTRRIF